MGLFKSIKKFGKSVAKTVVRAAPSAGVGFATGGPAGALLGASSFLQQRAAGKSTLAPGTGIFGGLQTSFGGPFGFPTAPGPMLGEDQPVVMTGGELTLTQTTFDIIVKLAGRLGIPIKRPSSVVRIGRSIIAKLLRFARANPGLTIINLLLNLGLSAFEANEIISWWATKGKRRRRIRVTNVKALNRSVRRLEGFRKLSHRVEMALVGRGGARRRTVGRRCPRCRKSPCCC